VAEHWLFARVLKSDRNAIGFFFAGRFHELIESSRGSFHPDLEAERGDSADAEE
jgi:hypothetical protein